MCFVDEEEINLGQSKNADEGRGSLFVQIYEHYRPWKMGTLLRKRLEGRFMQGTTIKMIDPWAGTKI